MSSAIVTRFAPSPTGLLHPGHAFSALFAFEAARRNGGRFVLRIEDIDFTRCRREFEDAILEDLAWLGIAWETPVRRQSDHLHEYATAAEQLRVRGLLYPCFCTRKDIQREIEAAGAAPHGPEGPLYPGLCRSLSEDERQSRIASGESFAMRLDLNRALAETGGDLEWIDLERGPQQAQPEILGDVVLVRKDIGCSYHLAVVMDDALQGVTRITRGEDLFEATHVQRLLQALLDLPTPEYHHHPLICDWQGKRFAKRDDAETLRSLRLRGVTVSQLRVRLGFSQTYHLKSH
ncbi:MAG: tRNA glutamyl-Q(34) synthetase GluQRS [Fuerstia sp.]|nr:tRNA glutamyl-Q(34) synthetase GluQRS [Fuerstiella sp.]